MKKLLFCVLAAIFFCTLIGCGSSGSSASSQLATTPEDAVSKLLGSYRAEDRGINTGSRIISFTDLDGIDWEFFCDAPEIDGDVASITARYTSTVARTSASLRASAEPLVITLIFKLVREGLEWIIEEVTVNVPEELYTEDGDDISIDFEANGYDMISGTVKDVNGNLLSGAAVALYSAQQLGLSECLGICTTASDGTFSFKDLAGGSYVLVIAADGYDSQTYSGKIELKGTVFAVTADAKTVEAGKTLQLSASLNGKDATSSVSWTSSDQAVASVDSTGLVSGSAAGSVVITASMMYNGKKISITCDITVTAAISPAASDEMWVSVDSEKGSIYVFVYGASTDGTPSYSNPSEPYLILCESNGTTNCGIYGSYDESGVPVYAESAELGVTSFSSLKAVPFSEVMKITEASTGSPDEAVGQVLLNLETYLAQLEEAATLTTYSVFAE